MPASKRPSKQLIERRKARNLKLDALQARADSVTQDKKGIKSQAAASGAKARTLEAKADSILKRKKG